jgi:hypothetical protein
MVADYLFYGRCTLEFKVEADTSVNVCGFWEQTLYQLTTVECSTEKPIVTHQIERVGSSPVDPKAPAPTPKGGTDMMASTAGMAGIVTASTSGLSGFPAVGDTGRMSVLWMIGDETGLYDDYQRYGEALQKTLRRVIGCGFDTANLICDYRDSNR